MATRRCFLEQKTCCEKEYRVKSLQECDNNNNYYYMFRL